MYTCVRGAIGGLVSMATLNYVTLEITVVNVDGPAVILAEAQGRQGGHDLYVMPRPGSGLGRGSCREGFNRYCIGKTPRQTQDNPQNILRDTTQNSSSTIGLHVYNVYTLEISRQKSFVPSSGGCFFLSIRGQNRTKRKEGPIFAF